MTEKTGTGPSAPETNVCGAAVPRILHQIWVQGLPAGEPGALIRGAQLVVTESGGWHHCLWSHARMLADLPAYRDLHHHCRTFAHYANLGRFAALAEFGGLYLDADVDLRRLPDDLRGAWIWTCDEGGRMVNPAALAAPPRHPYLLRLLEGCATRPVWRTDFAKNAVALCGACIGPDVQRWPREAWLGGAGSFGEHRGRCDAWGSWQLYGS